MPSSKLCHEDGLSRIIPQNREHLEDTLIASLRVEVAIKILCNSVQELPVTLKEIKNKALDDNFIVEEKKKLKYRS